MGYEYSALLDLEMKRVVEACGKLNSPKNMWNYLFYREILI